MWWTNLIFKTKLSPLYTIMFKIPFLYSKFFYFLLCQFLSKFFGRYSGIQVTKEILYCDHCVQHAFWSNVRNFRPVTETRNFYIYMKYQMRYIFNDFVLIARVQQPIAMPDFFEKPIRYFCGLDLPSKERLKQSVFSASFVRFMFDLFTFKSFLFCNIRFLYVFTC